MRFDSGAAPNPFWGICTLTICKPKIRNNAKIGDWIIGTGSKSVILRDGKLHDFSKSLVYAMQVQEILNLQQYDLRCSELLVNKIPNFKTSNWKYFVGDCIYDYSAGSTPKIRKGVHNEDNRATDLSGTNALLSKKFYYFGEKAIRIPEEFSMLIKRGPGHKIIKNEELILGFETWLKKHKKNSIMGKPQKCYLFKRSKTKDALLECSNNNLKED